MRKIIAILGQTAVGKSTLAYYLHKRYGFDVFEISAYVSRSFDSRGDNEYATLLEYANDCYLAGSLSQFTQRAINDSRKNENNLVFCGIRTEEDIELIRSNYPSLMTIKVLCPVCLREERYKKRATDSNSLSYRDKVENSWSKHGIEEIESDLVLINNSSMNRYYENIDLLMNTI